MQFLKEFAASGKKNTSLWVFDCSASGEMQTPTLTETNMLRRRRKKKKNYPNILSNAKLGLVFHKALQVYAV